LDYDKPAQELICKFDRLAYTIDKDIPVLLENEARHIDLEGNTRPANNSSNEQEV